MTIFLQKLFIIWTVGGFVYNLLAEDAKTNDGEWKRLFWCGPLCWAVFVLIVAGKLINEKWGER